jgi:hypothetical protein
MIQMKAMCDNWNHLIPLRDMKYIGFKHQRENKQNSDKGAFRLLTQIHVFLEHILLMFLVILFLFQNISPFADCR